MKRCLSFGNSNVLSIFNGNLFTWDLQVFELIVHTVCIEVHMFPRDSTPQRIKGKGSTYSKEKKSEEEDILSTASQPDSCQIWSSHIFTSYPSLLNSTFSTWKTSTGAKRDILISTDFWQHHKLLLLYWYFFQRLLVNHSTVGSLSLILIQAVKFPFAALFHHWA